MSIIIPFYHCIVQYGTLLPLGLFTTVCEMYSMFHKREDGHEDSIWSVAWARSEKDNSENIVTGGVDDLVKTWNWRLIL